MKRTPPGRKKGFAIAIFFEANSLAVLSDRELQKRLGIDFNNARKDIERWARDYSLGNVKRDPQTGLWKSWYAQATSLTGTRVSVIPPKRFNKGRRLLIILRGPQGSGKSLVNKILTGLLPLTRIGCEFEISEEPCDE